MIDHFKNQFNKLNEKTLLVFKVYEKEEEYSSIENPEIICMDELD